MPRDKVHQPKAASASLQKRRAWVEPEITAMKLASAAVVTIPVGP